MNPSSSDALVFFGATLIARQGYVEEAWRIVGPGLKAGSELHEYEPNSWVPREADQKVMPFGVWQNPVLTG